MIVKVTQEHINRGRKNRATTEYFCESCPVALALKDIFKVEETWASLSKLIVGKFPENIIFEVPTPVEVFEWIIKFDQDIPVEPFEFELSLEGVKL